MMVSWILSVKLLSVCCSAIFLILPLNQLYQDLLFRSSTGDGELDTQREVIISMLLRYISHPTVISTIASILTWIRGEAGGEEKSRKLSRQILDVLLPQLCGHQVCLESRYLMFYHNCVVTRYV